MCNLYLDDIRMPPDNSCVIVRSYDEFIFRLSQQPMPDMISFDHDLGICKDGKIAKTGMDCAKWIVEKEYKIKEFKVHSANPVGKANIEGLLNQWKEYNK